MKRLQILVVLLCCLLNASAQNVTEVLPGMQKVIDACIAMRNAAETKDSTALCRAASDLKMSKVKSFDSMVSIEGLEPSIKGHLVFDPDFAIKLANGDSTVYDKADDIIKSRVYKGQTPDGAYFTKHSIIKAGKSSKYCFNSKGFQELAVVAESGGLLTMKIHVTNSVGLNCRYDDTKLVKKGMPQRKVAFMLPDDRTNKVELEVINCSNKDCSFVIISN